MSGGALADMVNFTVPAFGYHDSFGTAYGFYLDAATYPVTDTTLVDYDMRTTGYHRIKLTSSGTVVLEIAYGNTAVSLTSNPIPRNTWIWIGAYSHAINGAVTTYLTVTGPGRQVLSSVSTGGLTGFYSIDSGPGPTFPANFGWGVSLSSTYANAANDGSIVMSKFDARYGAPLYPTSDHTDGQQDCLARQPLGIASMLYDSGTGTYHLGAGPQGLTINSDGPFESWVSTPAAPGVTPTLRQ